MKGFIAGFVFLITGLIVGGQENALIALPVGSRPESGDVTALELIQDFRGGMYILSITDGEFRILKGGQGEELKPYIIDGFDGNLLKARDLAMVSGGPEQYSAFIGTRDGVEGIYLFGLSYMGELAYYPLRETESPAGIAAYSLISSNDQGLLIFILTDGRLNYISGGGRNDRITSSREISLRSEKVEDFEVFHDWGRKTNYGWYRVFREDHWEINFFLIGEQGLLIREETGPYETMPRIEHRESQDGNPAFTVLDNKSVSVYQISGGGFVRSLDFDAPLKVQRYIPGLLIGDTDTGEIIYGVSFEQSGIPVLKQLFSLPGASLIDIFSTGTNQISLIYYHDRTWRFALIDLAEGLKKEGPIQTLNEPARMFYTAGFLSPRFCVLKGNEENGILAFFRFEDENWKLLREIPAPRGSFFQGEKNILLNPFYMENEIITMISPDMLVLIDDKNGKEQSLDLGTYTWSRRINGVIYLAVYTGNEITLYRMEE
ncbi:hypothetical protein [Treponema primitia]|uniref:hypothetical protein n=1 Tax=Treponema primitia TaxID=88058 RepID=UPI00025555B9|nr:hypothetical protein [Treponema primitia]